MDVDDVAQLVAAFLTPSDHPSGTEIKRKLLQAERAARRMRHLMKAEPLVPRNTVTVELLEEFERETADLRESIIRPSEDRALWLRDIARMILRASPEIDNREVFRLLRDAYEQVQAWADKEGARVHIEAPDERTLRRAVRHARDTTRRI